MVSKSGFSQRLLFETSRVNFNPSLTLHQKYLRYQLRRFLEPISASASYYFLTVKANGKYSKRFNLEGIIYYIDYVNQVLRSVCSLGKISSIFIYEDDKMGHLHIHGYIKSDYRLDYFQLPKVLGLRVDLQLIRAFTLSVQRCKQCGFLDEWNFYECERCRILRSEKDKIEDYLFKNNYPLIVRIEKSIFTADYSTTAYWL